MRSVILLLSLGLTGCIATLTNKEHFDKYGLQRAEFETSCPAKDLRVQFLNADPVEKASEDGAIRCKAGAQVGVTGCGKKVVYVCAWPSGWVANTSSEQPGT